MKDENEGYEHRRGFELRETEKKLQSILNSRMTMEERFWRIPFKRKFVDEDCAEVVEVSPEEMLDFINSELSSLVGEILGKKMQTYNPENENYYTVPVDDVLKVARDRGIDI